MGKNVLGGGHSPGLWRGEGVRPHAAVRVQEKVAEGTGQALRPCGDPGGRCRVL